MFDKERLEWLNGQWIRKLSDEELVERRCRSWSTDLAEARGCGAEVACPTADDLRPLMPMVRERLPTLAAIGPLVDFLFVEELRVEPDTLVPKSWDARDDGRRA